MKVHPRDNGDVSGKVKVRQWALAQLGGPKKAKVLELFGGTGLLHDRCYTGVAQHMAFDVRKIDRPTWLQGDNRTLLPVHVNAGFNLYDADAYNNPWIPLADVCRLRTPGKFAAVATEGLRRGIKNRHSNGYLRKVSGLNGLSDVRLALRWYDDLVRWVIADWSRFGVRAINCVRLRAAHSSDMYYYALTLEKK